MSINTSPRGLIVGAVNFATKELDELRSLIPITYTLSKTRDEFFEDCQTKYKDVEVIFIGANVSLCVDCFLKKKKSYRAHIENSTFLFFCM